jgi:hypothetical protein
MWEIFVVRRGMNPKKPVARICINMNFVGMTIDQYKLFSLKQTFAVKVSGGDIVPIIRNGGYSPSESINISTARGRLLRASVARLLASSTNDK